jgi:hypothetical protein
MYKGFRLFTPLMAMALLLLTTACNRADRNRVPVARVDNTWLYLDDVTHTIPDGAKASDSIFAVRSFTDQWIRQQILLKHAEENLREAKPDFERQLRDYRNSLLIYSFEEQLVQQNLDTVVTDQQIRAYYDANKEDFILKDNIVKVLYVKLFRNDPSAAPIRRLMQNLLDADRLKLAALCRQSAVNYYLDDEVWLFFNDLLKEIPIVTYNQEAFITNNRFVEINDSVYHYIIAIRDFRITDNYSPVSLEKERIRFSILNQRKAALLQKLSEDLYQRASRKSRFETFY